MADILFLEVPVEAGLELGAIVRLDDQDSKGEPPDNLVHEADGRRLVAGIVDLEHPNARAVVDGRELIEAPSRACNPLKELHVHLYAMPGLKLLVSLPGPDSGPKLLVGRQPVHTVTDQ